MIFAVAERVRACKRSLVMPANMHLVTAHQGRVYVGSPPRWLSSREAIELAAWLVCMADVNASCASPASDDERAISSDALGEFTKALREARNS